MAHDFNTGNYARFILAKGFLNLITYNQLLNDHGVDPENSVFIFPSNTGHHTREHSLYSFKSGGGLAAVAHQLCEKGIAVLGLPTTGMPQIDANAPPNPVAKAAIEDLWRAAGFGLTLVLPVRDFASQQSGIYFSRPIQNTQLEPSFWGQNLLIPNKPLGDYYVLQLETLQRILSEESEIQNAGISRLDPDFVKAYQQGIDARTHPTKWFARISR